MLLTNHFHFPVKNQSEKNSNTDSQHFHLQNLLRHFVCPLLPDVNLVSEVVVLLKMLNEYEADKHKKFSYRYYLDYLAHLVLEIVVM